MTQGDEGDLGAAVKANGQGGHANSPTDVQVRMIENTPSGNQRETLHTTGYRGRKAGNDNLTTMGVPCKNQ
jgi:hypothetical protein